ncbi:predicted protein [Histoplasma capsulatum H143]|uniref:Uncharacterized protein n=1 Tax=Ajellomyces capsulatus (strain H143) TaxID=544712 RepID=C6HET0_AJECH|nr:predicted protein [Histoplasma capsulatum H143]
MRRKHFVFQYLFFDVGRTRQGCGCPGAYLADIFPPDLRKKSSSHVSRRVVPTRESNYTNLPDSSNRDKRELPTGSQSVGIDNPKSEKKKKKESNSKSRKGYPILESAE